MSLHSASAHRLWRGPRARESISTPNCAHPAMPKIIPEENWCRAPARDMGNHVPPSRNLNLFSCAACARATPPRSQSRRRRAPGARAAPSSASSTRAPPPWPHRSRPRALRLRDDLVMISARARATRHALTARPRSRARGVVARLLRRAVRRARIVALGSAVRTHASSRSRSAAWCAARASSRSRSAAAARTPTAEGTGYAAPKGTSDRNWRRVCEAQKEACAGWAVPARTLALLRADTHSSAG